ncbi:MAG: hypothetical protein QM784_13860 [Polyangiaceae bacterium]
MLHDLRLGGVFFGWLHETDRQISKCVAAEGCQFCGGRLHQGTYLRKPRGAKIAEGVDGFALRHSLCCGQEGCRRRTLPPSLRFLGRRVYFEAVVFVASVVALALGGEGAAHRVTLVPVRTSRRWDTWWRETFPSSLA